MGARRHVDVRGSPPLPAPEASIQPVATRAVSGDPLFDRRIARFGLCISRRPIEATEVGRVIVKQAEQIPAVVVLGRQFFS